MPTVPLSRTSVEQRSVGVPVAQVPAASNAGNTAINQAIGNLGETIMQSGQMLSEHVQRQKAWNDQETAYDASEKYRTELMQKAYDETPKSITRSDGSKIDVASGWLMRQGYGADGLTKEMIPEVQKTKEKYMATLSPNAQRLFLRTADTYAASTIEQGIKHQAAQMHDAGVQTYGDSINGLVSTSTNARTPEELNAMLDHIDDTYGNAKTFDPAQFDDTKRDRFATKAVANAVNNTMLRTGSLEEAQAMLSSVSNKIPPEQYDKIQKQLQSNFEVLQKNIKHEETVTKVNNEMGILKALAGTTDGKYPDALDVETMSANNKVRSEFAQAYSAAVEAFSKQRYKPNTEDIPFSLDVDTNAKNQDFARHMRSIAEHQDQDGMLTELTNMMKKSAEGHLSEDKLKIALFYAIQKSQAIPTVLTKEMPQNEDDKSAAGRAADAGMKQLYKFLGNMNDHDPKTYNAYIQGIASGKTPKQAFDFATTGHFQKVVPALALQDGLPTGILDGNTKFLVQKAGTRGKWMYDDKTGTMIPNPEYKAGKEKDASNR